MTTDVALVTVTLISLVLVLAMGVVTWRAVREERRRAGTRMDALAADLDQAAQAPARPVVRRPQRPPPAPARVPAAPAVRRRFLGVAAAVVLLAAVGVVIMSRGAASDPATESAPGVRPVELLSLGHVRQGAFLDISGTVRNPGDGSAWGQLHVTTTVFDEDGEVVGSQETPLPVATLAPDGEASFTISMPDADRINLYRVSFAQGGMSVPHIDRRQTEQTRSAPPSGEHP